MGSGAVAARRVLMSLLFHQNNFRGLLARTSPLQGTSLKVIDHVEGFPQVFCFAGVSVRHSTRQRASSPRSVLNELAQAS